MKNKKLFYNTGFKLIFSAWDRLKFKIRLADYCDVDGIRYCYLIAIKIFIWEEKYIKGKVDLEEMYNGRYIWAIY